MKPPQQPEKGPTGKGPPEKGERRLKKSVHVCPKCGFTIDLKDLGLRRSTTGLVTCPKCEWSGPIAIGVVPKEQ